MYLDPILSKFYTHVLNAFVVNSAFYWFGEGNADFNRPLSTQPSTGSTAVLPWIFKGLDQNPAD